MPLERWHLYGLRVPYQANGFDPLTIWDRVIQIQDLPGPYYLRQLQIFDNIGRLVRFRNGRGDYAMSDFLPTSMVGGSNPMPVWKQLEYPFNSQFRFDVYQPFTEASSDMWIVLHGAHRLADNPEKLYPDNFRETPYTHQVNVTLGPNQRLKIPLFLRFNTPFALRALTAGKSADGVDDPSFETLVNLQDHNGQNCFNIPLPWDMAFTGGNLPITPSPELVMPPGRAYTLELVTGAGAGSQAYQFDVSGALLNAV